MMEINPMLDLACIVIRYTAYGTVLVVTVRRKSFQLRAARSYTILFFGDRIVPFNSTACCTVRWKSIKVCFRL